MCVLTFKRKWKSNQNNEKKKKNAANLHLSQQECCKINKLNWNRYSTQVLRCYESTFPLLFSLRVGG